MLKFLFRSKSDVASTKSERTRSHKENKTHERYALANSKRLTSTFDGMGLSVDETLRRDLARIRSASRKGGEDSGYVKKYFGMVQTHVVGDRGFRLQSQVRKKRGATDDIINGKIEEAWKAFGKLGVCEISGRMDITTAEQLIVKTVCQDGDILIRHIDGAPNRFGYAFELIESDRLDIGLYKKLQNGNVVKMGVELDSYGRHVAYHLLTNHPGEYHWSAGGRKYLRIPADQIILPFPMWRPGQTRGVPWAHAALLDMHDIAGYREATLVSSRIGASNMVMYERDPEQPPPDGESWNDDGEFVAELEPGSSSVTPPGYRARETNFQMPSEGVADFQKAALRGASSGVEANYNVLGNDYEGVSWSSLRQAILEDREHWKRMQGWFSSQVMNPIYERFLYNALLVGAIDGVEAHDLQRCKSYTFRGRRWQWVDPLKDEQSVGEGYKNFSVNPMDVLNDKGVDLEEMSEGWRQFLDRMEPHILRAQAIGLVKTSSVMESKTEEPDQESNSTEDK